MATTFEVITGSSGEQETATKPVPAPAATASSDSGNSVKTQPAIQQAAGTPASGGGMSYEDLYKALNPYSPPTKEELEKEKKKQKREAIVAALSDGVAAMSNLFFTTQYAPNMYDGKNTTSEKLRIRYDKLLKDSQNNAYAYINGLMGAKKADDAKAENERQWQQQLDNLRYRKERDKLADDRYEAQQKKEQERYEDEKARRKAADDAAADKWQQEFDEKKRNNDRNHNFRVQQQKDNKDLQEQRIRATSARAVRGNQLAFSDGDGNEVSIYENVWKGSMQQVYDALVSDLAPEDEKERSRYERQMKKYDTPQKKEDFVKQNWHRSAKARAIMLALSKLDPATMTSEITDDEIIDYDPSNDDDVIDYVPGK